MKRAGEHAVRLVTEVIRKAPLTPEKVSFAWKLTVGPAIARISDATLDEAGTLHVRADTSHWAREIRRASPTILPRLADVLGRDVALRLVTRTSGGVR